MQKTKVEWADWSWNPITGCDDKPISPGCENCYARGMARRLAGRVGYPEAPNHFKPTVHYNRFNAPKFAKKPKIVFTCSMGDLFHKDNKTLDIHEILGIITEAKQHFFLILTKRPIRMRQLMRDYYTVNRMHEPIPNLGLGVTAENQKQADIRLPVLRYTRAAMRFVSVEPMLSAVNLLEASWCPSHYPASMSWEGTEREAPNTDFIDWVMCGGETGYHARPPMPHWFSDLQAQCKHFEIPFFFKAWGGPYRNGWVFGGKTYKGKKLHGVKYQEQPAAIEKYFDHQTIKRVWEKIHDKD